MKAYLRRTGAAVLACAVIGGTMPAAVGGVLNTVITASAETTGEGTQENPYVVTTYDDLYTLLNTSGISSATEQYIKLGADIVSEEDKNDYKDVIIHIVYLTSFRYVINILKILTIYYFTQNHIYTTYVFIKLVDYLIRKKHWIRFLSIILFVFQFLGLLIYLEIIELNFLKLNKNTKNNIKKSK